MGTRYEDQPAEHWAGAESLDPTPVWKQYVLIALLLVIGLVLVVGVGLTALAPLVVTPPALVPGDRLVLSASDAPAAGQPPKLIAAPIVDDVRSFYLVQPAKGEILAMRVRWAPRASEPECRIVVLAGTREPAFEARDCAVFRPPETAIFDARGTPASAAANRALDQYLVSVSGDRLVVNLSRVITASEPTNAPIPTGIPRPQQTP